MDGYTSGYTLPELLVALSIISALSVLGFPTLNSKNANIEARQFTLLLQRSLSFAKGTAVGGGERVTLCASNDSQHCLKSWHGNTNILVFTDRNQNHQMDEGDLLHQSQALELRYGQVYWHGSGGRRYMRFRVNGSAVEFGRYTYCPFSGEQKNFRQLVINHVGRAYQHHDGSGKTTDCV